MKILISLLLVLLAASAPGQQPDNLDFEITDQGNPLNWKTFGSDGYVFRLDTVLSYQGNNAGLIEYVGGALNFKACARSIPARYEGKKIKLSGYIKTEAVSEGWAGLWLRIDPEVGFDNMQNRGITGTTEWTQYEIELDLNPQKARDIVFGGILVGKGRMWVDDLRITIDGQDLADVKQFEIPSSRAEQDTAYRTGSNITIPVPDIRLTEDLVLLGKIWGFLKYHHPEIGKGTYNWDNELFRILPGYLNNNGQAERDQILLDWIAQLGPIPACSTCQHPPADAFLKPEMDWVETTDMIRPLKDKLYFIHQNRHQGEHYYISMAPNIGNPVFEHESSFANMPFPDDGYRLLALYRYWNMIRYFFPYRHLIEKSWDDVLALYIPVFIRAGNELEYEQAAVRIIGDVQDTHANLWGGGNALNAWKGHYQAAVHVRFVEDHLVVTDYYNPELKERTGLEIGDVITKIDGKNIGEIIDTLRPYYPASNEPTRLRDISMHILRSNNTSLTIAYDRKGDVQTRQIPLYERDSLKIYRWFMSRIKKCYEFIDEQIGYVTLENIKPEDIPVIRDTFRNTQGLIIDIRNYPSTFVPFLLGSWFVEKPTPFVKFTMGSIDVPGTFTFSEMLEIPNQGATYRGKLVVIVNEWSQSNAEYTAMAFRAGNNTTIIGSTTAGADGNVSAISLPGGLRTMISGIGVYYPDGTETQRRGIVPDIEVKPTIEGIRNNKDEVLEKAIELIRGKR